MTLEETVENLVAAAERGADVDALEFPGPGHTGLASQLVDLIRAGSRRQLLQAAASLATIARRSQSADSSSIRPLVLFASDILSKAASNTDSAAVPMALKSHDGKSMAVVATAVAEGSVPRTRLLDLLGVSESHLSHILRDLDAAGLISRVQEGRTVVVSPTNLATRTLGLEDHAVVAGFIETVRQFKERSVVDVAEVARELAASTGLSRRSAESVVNTLRSRPLDQFDDSELAGRAENWDQRGVFNPDARLELTGQTT